MAKKTLTVGTLFSGIGAFEHALIQLGIEHKILFACDCGERELPLKYGDLAQLTKEMSDDSIFDLCKNYIDRIGVKVEFREIATECATIVHDVCVADFV